VIYLDHASRTPTDPQVLAEFCRVENEFFANPMISHAAGRMSNDEINRVTTVMAKLLGASPNEIIFTSGATESNNLAIKGLTRAYRHTGKHIITTCLEHSSVSSPLAVLKDQGYEVELVDILPNGTVDLDHFRVLLRHDTVLVCVSWVDSELGAVQPIQAIREALEKYPNCRLHVDASQAVGKIPVSFEHIDTLSFSPHKFNGICGCGVLLKKKSTLLDIQIHGGLSATAYRSGTTALSLASSSCKALELAIARQNERFEKVQALRQYVVQALTQYPQVRINSPKDGSPYILNLSVKGIKGSDFQAILDEHGVCISVKSACSAVGTLSRPVLAVSKDKKNALNSWRIGFSHITEFAEVEEFLKIFAKIIERT